MEVAKKQSHQPSFKKAQQTESDVLIRCRNNAAKLEEMINRFGFVMREIESALRTLNRKLPSETRVLYQAAFAAGAAGRADRSPRD